MFKENTYVCPDERAIEALSIQKENNSTSEKYFSLKISVCDYKTQSDCKSNDTDALSKFLKSFMIVNEYKYMGVNLDLYDEPPMTSLH